MPFHLTIPFISLTKYLSHKKATFTSKLVLFTLLLLGQLQVGAVPIISSFTPKSGPVGSVVTITGSGFAPITLENSVLFGGIKAKVLSANENVLSVEVPKGACYSQITVSSEGSTAYSTLSFDPTFKNIKGISKGTFWQQEKILDLPSPLSVANADFDGDGLTDIVSVGDGINDYYRLFVYRNTSKNGSVSFAGKQVLGSAKDSITGNGNSLEMICTADIDGDGKLDITVTKYGYTAYVYRNTSTIGSISFDEPLGFPFDQGLFQTGKLSFGDLNSDGKPDLLAGGGRSPFFIMLINNSTPGHIAFLEKQKYDMYSFGIYDTDIFEVSMGDFDNDGKTDLILSGDQELSPRRLNTRFLILRNISSGVYPSFDVVGDIISPASLTYKVSIGDLDGDEKLDLVAKASEGVLRIYKNTSSQAGISFAPSIDYSSISYTYHSSISDMDGDGKADIVIIRSDTVSVLKNISTIDNISFEAEIDYEATGASHISIGDINFDGKPDIIYTSLTSDNLFLLKNKIGWSGIISLCPGSDTSFTTSTVGSIFQWQFSTDNGNSFTNIANNEFYEGASTNKLLLKEAPSLFYGYHYRCISNIDTSDTYTIKFTNQWTGTNGNDWGNAANWSCGTIPDGNTDVVVNSGDLVVVNGNYACRSLTINSNAIVTVNAGSTLKITH